MHSGSRRRRSRPRASWPSWIGWWHTKALCGGWGCRRCGLVVCVAGWGSLGGWGALVCGCFYKGEQEVLDISCCWVIVGVRGPGGGAFFGGVSFRGACLVVVGCEGVGGSERGRSTVNTRTTPPELHTFQTTTRRTSPPSFPPTMRRSWCACLWPPCQRRCGPAWRF